MLPFYCTKSSYFGHGIWQTFSHRPYSEFDPGGGDRRGCFGGVVNVWQIQRFHHRNIEILLKYATTRKFFQMFHGLGWVNF